jgi:hypothetical protein
LKPKNKYIALFDQEKGISSLTGKFHIFAIKKRHLGPDLFSLISLDPALDPMNMKQQQWMQQHSSFDR